jgi:Icc-related predicted phosphoesterase
MYTQKEAEELFKNFEKVDVLITHSPPFWIQDNNDYPHIWLKTFNNYIKNKNPKYLLHWHTYPKDKKTIYMNTEILYTYWSNIIELKF